MNIDERAMQLITRLHTPEELRMLSNYAHWIEGAIFLTVAVILLLKASGRIQLRKADLLWPGLIFGAGFFLLIYIFIHHSPDQYGLVWQVILIDPQQRQHVIMAVLLTLTASLQLLFTLKKISWSWVVYAWPATLLIIGLLFLLHPQHGTPEAIAYMKPYHTFLGTVILFGGITTAITFKRNAAKIFTYGSIFLLFLSSALLLLYREPKGAYMVEMNGQRQDMSRSGIVMDYVSFVDALRAEGIDVTPGEKIDESFFSVPAQTLKLEKGQIQVFTYKNTSAADKDAAIISPDGGTIGTHMITWVEPPHFYRTGKIIVLYPGNDKQTLLLLESLLGPQFAGR